MKIAFPANGKIISNHFGHCISFKLFTIDNQKNITKEESLENSGGHKPGVLPKLLEDNEVNIIIADGIGQKAIDIFNQIGIKVITGASGLIAEALKNFLAGNLQDSGKICNH